MSTYKEDLLDRLKDFEYALHYLLAACCQDDEATYNAAVANIIKVHGTS